MTQPGESDTPRSVVERAAAAAMTAVEISLQGEGAELRKMFVLIYAGNVPAGELDCTSAGAGYEDGRDMLVELFTHFSGAAKAMGIEVKLASLGRG